jgi:hypothetical protein
MATILANQTGNWSATSTWVGGVLPTSGDVVVANNKTVTVDISPTVSEVRNDATGGATAGGSFTLSSGVTLRANVISGSGNSVNNCVAFGGASPNSASIVGNVFFSSAGNMPAVQNNSSGTLNIVGNCDGGFVNYLSNAVTNASSGVINITGTVTGGPIGSSHGVVNSAGGTINISGVVVGGKAGNIWGALNQSTGTINITGSVLGGSVSTAYGVNNQSTGTVTIVGSATGGNVSPAAFNTTTGILNVTRAVGNGFGLGSSGMTSQPGVVSNVAGSLTNVEEIEYGSLGQSPTSGPIRFVDKTSNVALFYRGSSFSSKKTLVDSSVVAGGVPASSDVRSGVSYNLGANVGSCVIPNANSVVFGVPVDGTTGSAVLSPASVWNFLISNMSTSGSIGERVKNCATVSSVGKQLEQVL